MDLDKCLKKNGDPCQFFCLQYEFFCGNSMACRREDNSSVRRHSGLEIEKKMAKIIFGMNENVQQSI